MAVITGTSGNVKISTNAVAEIDSFSLTVGPNLTDTASFGDSWEEKTATLKRASGSFSGRLDNTDTNGLVALRTAAMNGTTVALRLYEDSDSYFSGNAFIELTASAEVNGTVNVSCNFTGTGTWSYT